MNTSKDPSLLAVSRAAANRATREKIRYEVESRERVDCSNAFRERWSFDECHLFRYLEEHAPYLKKLRRSKRKRLFGQTGATKKLMRIKVYEYAFQMLSSRMFDLSSVRDPRILILAGGEPEHETALARRLFPSVQLISFDLDDRAVVAARRFVDLSVQVDLADLRFRGPEKAPDCLISGYVFANLDFCGLVTTDGVSHSIDRVGHMTGLLATWFSYGHEQSMPAIRNIAEYFGHGAEQYLSLLPEAVRVRLIYVWKQIANSNPNPNNYGRITLRPLKVWTYRDQRMPMMCVLWTHVGGWGGAFDGDVLSYENVSVSESDFRALVLSNAIRCGTKNASELYGVRPARIAARRAVATRQR